jgi:hypothetical protein
VLFATLGAATAWSLQLLIDYSVAAHRCFPGDRPVINADLPSTWAHLLLAAVNLLAIGLAILSIAAARSVWNRTKDEHESSTENLLTAGPGRTRFIAMCGQLAGLGFLTAILFDTIPLYVVSRCFG